MIQSMTGYAALGRETTQGSLFLELKSVNNRFLDLQFRLVEELRSLATSNDLPLEEYVKKVAEKQSVFESLCRD